MLKKTKEKIYSAIILDTNDYFLYTKTLFLKYKMLICFYK